MIDDILSQFDTCLHSKRIEKMNIPDDLIIDCYEQAIEKLVINYNDYRSNIPILIGIIDRYKAYEYSLSIFFNLYNEIISAKSVVDLDLSIFDKNASEELRNKYLQAANDWAGSSKIFRLTESYFDIDQFSLEEMKEISALIIRFFEHSAINIEWKKDHGHSIIFHLSVLKKLLDRLNKTDLFYYACTTCIDRLNTSGYFQAARDVSEEIVCASFKDRIQYLGFLVSFQCYSRQNNVFSSFLYAILSFVSLIQSKAQITNRYLQKIIWESIIFFRNTNLHPFAINIYKDMPKQLSFSDYERRSIDNSYFYCLLKLNDANLPDKLIDYLNKEREALFGAGIIEAVPWLILLYNIKRLYPNADFSATSLGYYLNIFETIVPQDMIVKHKNIINGTSTNNKDYLKQSIIKLWSTRNLDDIKYDIHHALTIANRLISIAFETEDNEAILLAMSIKSDFSLIFNSKNAAQYVVFELQDDNLEYFESIYSDDKQFIETIDGHDNDLIIWLAACEDSLYQLTLFAKKFIYLKLTSFNFLSFNDLIKQNYFSALSFDDIQKDAMGIRPTSLDEHFEQANRIKKAIAFARIAPCHNAEEILIVKDMKLAMFPHNLFLDQHGDFIHLKKPVANILSTEWYIKNRLANNINNSYSKSIWIPTESGDITLNMLFGSISADLKKYKFKIIQNTQDEMIEADLKIVCAHGSTDIASYKAIYPMAVSLDGNEPSISSGKILIFFVCHAGSYKYEYFQTDILSIVKTFISTGYQAVIAPFWSLHVNIPKIWLTAFLSNFENGKSINASNFHANRAVFEQFPTPAAWACMHLYGNPQLKVC